MTARINLLEIIGNADKGGMENFLKDFLSHLPRENFAVTCICPYESKFTSELRELGVREVYTGRIEDDPYWRSIQLAVEIGKMDKIDIIHAHMPKAHLLAGIAGSLLHKPVVATIHGMDITAHELGIAQAVGSHLLTNNQEAFIQAIAMGIPFDRVNLVRNGVNTALFTPTANSGFKESIGISASTPVIGFVGRLAYEKGPDLFLKAAQHIHYERPDIRFMIVGEGSMKPELETLCKTFQMTACVHFVEWQTDTWKLYPMIDLLVHSSRSDGTSLVLLEAMACGIPTVAIGVGGVREVVEHGSTGLLVSEWEELPAHVLYLLKEPKIMQQMSVAAVDRVNSIFNLDSNTKKTAQIITDLARKTGRFETAENSFAIDPLKAEAPVRNLNS